MWLGRMPVSCSTPELIQASASQSLKPSLVEHRVCHAVATALQPRAVTVDVGIHESGIRIAEM